LLIVGMAMHEVIVDSFGSSWFDGSAEGRSVDRLLGPGWILVDGTSRWSGL